MEEKLRNDVCFLLSSEEYERYKDNIPSLYRSWWLRTPIEEGKVAYVYDDGNLEDYGRGVHICYLTVRPALRISYPTKSIGDRFIMYGHSWVMIDKDLAISESGIGQHRFDANSNSYETSEIRRFILDWIRNQLHEAADREEGDLLSMAADFEKLKKIKREQAYWRVQEIIYDTISKKNHTERKAVNIQWDVDIEDFDNEAEYEAVLLNVLPKEVIIPENVEDDEIADYLSDQFDYCVKSYSIINGAEKEK